MNPSVAYIRSSDGSGDASLMTITQVRTAPATTITVNTVAGVPTNFFATMGTPHTFNDPVTGETITVISEATAVSFAGRVDSGKIEIVAIAPGETDLGSKVGDIIIIRPTTQWADNIHGVLSKSLNDDGTLKNNAVTTAAVSNGSITAQKTDFSTFTPTTSSGWTISADGRRAMQRVSTTGLQTFGAGTTSAAFWFQEFTVALPTGFTVANASVNVTRVVAGEAEAKLTVGFNQTTGKFWMANTGAAAIGATSTIWINDILLEKKT